MKINPTSSEKSSRAADRILAMANQCVMCGLCLPVCPTYQSMQTESESPRGRIALARAAASGKQLTAQAFSHLDNCLSCGNCETACPSQVPYLALLAQSRSENQAFKRESWRRRLSRFILERPSWTRIFFYFGLIASPRWAAAIRRVKASSRKGLTVHANAKKYLPVRALFAKSVTLFRGCSGKLIDSSALNAASALLKVAGYEVKVADAQCCGALAYHAGDFHARDRLQNQFLNDFQYSCSDYCTSVASGCAAQYRHLTAMTKASVYMDIMELLVQAEPQIAFEDCDAVIALHWPCTLRADQRTIKATRHLLSKVMGLRVIELPDVGRCCGGAGTYFIDHEAIAKDLLAATLCDIETSKVKCVLSANPGCRLQLASKLVLPVLHPVEFLYGLIKP